MTAETKPHSKRWKIAVGILLAVLVLMAGGFFLVCVRLLPGGGCGPGGYWQAEIIWKFGMI